MTLQTNLSSPLAQFKIKLQKLWQRLRFLPFFSLFTLDKISWIQKCDVVLVAHDADRGYIFRGKAYSQLIDSVADLLTHAHKNHMTIALPFSKLRASRAYGCVISANGMFARAILKRFFIRRLLRKTTFNCPVKGVWEILLRRAAPDFVLGIQPSKELCLAGAELKIPVFDLQHGVVSDEGYYGQSYRRDIDQLGWPDAFLCWDANSVKWLGRQRPETPAVVVGHPWLSRFANLEETSIKDPLVEDAKTRLKFATDRPCILITLTYGLRQYSSAAPEIGIDQAVIDLILQSKINCRWLMRLHPIQNKAPRVKKLKSNLKKLFGHLPNVEWENSTEAPLPMILNLTNLHLTCLSSTAIEAAFFGVKTGFVFERKDLIQQWFGPLVKEGFATMLPSNRIAIERWLAESLNSPPVKPLDGPVSFDLDSILKLAYSMKTSLAPGGLDRRGEPKSENLPSVGAAPQS